MHQYQLQKYAGIQSRYRCPACNHRRKTFTLYINTQTNEPLNATVGKCDREDKCGYHFTPKMWFAGNGLSVVSYQLPVIHQKLKTDNRELKTNTIDYGLFQQTLKAYHKNHLVTFLTNTLGADAARTLIEKYRIGTAKHWPGATVFWQIDVSGKVRAGKIMLYDPTTGKRVKGRISWVHSVLQGSRIKEQGAKTKDSPAPKKSFILDPCSLIPADFQLQQCLFGEHLLAGNNHPVAIVESEKTALIASVLLPGMLWLACGGRSNLSAAICQVLKGREVHLFPDVNAYDDWVARAQTLMHDLTIVVSDMLETKADAKGRADGFDIADYLLKEDCVY